MNRIVAVSVILCVPLLFGGCGDNEDKTPPKSPAQIQAEAEWQKKQKILYDTQEYVKKNLKDPESAEFVDGSSAVHLQRFNGNDLALVIGKVRATNSFNAHIVSSYIVAVNTQTNKAIEFILDDDVIFQTDEGNQFIKSVLNSGK